MKPGNPMVFLSGNAFRQIRDDLGPQPRYGTGNVDRAFLAGIWPVRGGRTHEDCFYNRRGRQNL